MKIPKQLKLMGRTIEIVYDDNLSKVIGNSGEARFHQDKIVLVPLKSKARIMTKQELDVTFLEELLHWIQHLLKIEMPHDDVKRLSEIWNQIIPQIEDR
jgi:hypothetical protein